MSERLLDIQNLSVTFGGLNALSDLDFHVYITAGFTESPAADTI